MLVTSQSENCPPDSKAMLEHVVTVVLKEDRDGLLAKALNGGEINEIMDVLTLNQTARDALTYQEDDGTMKPLSIGHKGMLRAWKIFVNYCQANGAPMNDWTAVTKKNFDDFRCSEACMIVTERMIPFLLLCLFLPLSRSISSLTSRKRSREMLPCSWCWRIPNSETHGTSPPWHRLRCKMFLMHLIHQ